MQHRRAGRRDGGHVVVLGHPVAGVAEGVGGLRRRRTVAASASDGGLVAADGDEVEYGKSHESFNASGRPIRSPIRAISARSTAWRRQRAEIAVLAAVKTSSSIAGVSRPVNVFCWLGW